jgi:hypothetical protein
MPTTTVKSVGSGGGRDYSTIQAWEDACTANLVSADEIWKGELYNDSEFLKTSGAVLTVSGITTDKNRYLWLTTASGQGFKDASGADADDLQYDQSRGVGVRCTGTYTDGFNCGSTRVLIENIQFAYNTGGSYSSSWGMNGGSYRGCLIEQTKTSAFTNNAARFINCLLVDKSSTGSGQMARINDRLNSCTMVRPSDLTAGGTGTNQDFGYYPDLIDCAVFGFNTNFAGTIGSYNNCSYNASNSSSVPGTSAQTSLTYADQFETVTDSARDWRVKAGSSLESNGTRAQGTEGDLDLLGTNDLDILGRARSTTTPTIGCWEYIAGGGGPTEYTVTVTDGILMLDPSTRDQHHNLNEQLLLGALRALDLSKLVPLDSFLFADSHVRDRALAVTEQLLTSDVRYFDLLLARIDMLLLGDSSLQQLLGVGAEYTVAEMDSLFLNEARYFDILIGRLSSLFLYDTAATQVTSPGQTINEVAASDGLLLDDRRLSDLAMAIVVKMLLADTAYVGAEKAREALDKLLLVALPRALTIELNKTDYAILNDYITQARSILWAENLMFSESQATALIGTLVAYLVYARLRGTEFLGIRLAFKDYLGRKIGSTKWRMD